MTNTLSTKPSVSTSRCLFLPLDTFCPIKAVAVQAIGFYRLTIYAGRSPWREWCWLKAFEPSVSPKKTSDFLGARLLWLLGTSIGMDHGLDTAIQGEVYACLSFAYISYYGSGPLKNASLSFEVVAKQEEM